VRQCGDALVETRLVLCAAQTGLPSSDNGSETRRQDHQSQRFIEARARRSFEAAGQGAYGGNLSAAFSEAAKWLRQREARQRLSHALGCQP